MKCFRFVHVVTALALLAISAQAITSNGRSGAQSEAARKAAEARREQRLVECAAEQEEASLKAERMRTLPPEIALGVAKGSIAFDELSFTEDGQVVWSGDPAPGEAVATAGRGLFLRVGALALSAALILGGLFSRRGHQNPEPGIRNRESRIQNLES
ncbi:MAG: hypothetical protein PHW08_04350 [Kiritimatiellae bacterium]|nr:hypothetical protein [Kiritimatiellia bacterium]